MKWPRWMLSIMGGVGLGGLMGVGAWVLRAEQAIEQVPKLEEAVRQTAELLELQANSLDVTLNLCRLRKIDPKDWVCLEAEAEDLRRRQATEPP